MRDQTEWVELIAVGENELAGASTEEIISAVRRNLGRKIKDTERLYGGGRLRIELLRN